MFLDVVSNLSELKCLSSALKYLTWLSMSCGILTITFSPSPDGDTNTDITYSSDAIERFSAIISFLLAYPSKSRQISPLCSVIELSARLVNIPERHIAGSDFLSSLRVDLSCSCCMLSMSSLLEPFLILSSTTSMCL